MVLVKDCLHDSVLLHFNSVTMQDLSRSIAGEVMFK